MKVCQLWATQEEDWRGTGATNEVRTVPWVKEFEEPIALVILSERAVVVLGSIWMHAMWLRSHAVRFIFHHCGSAAVRKYRGWMDQF